MCYFCTMNFSSKLLEEAVQSLSLLPGIGKKTALRLALHLVQDKSGKIQRISEALSALQDKIRHCEKCNNLSDMPVCYICQDIHRSKHTICVVENARDVMAIEDTQQYSGLYHVLGGVIAPLEGIGPDDLCIPQLIDRIVEENVQEIIMAISPTIEGDTTTYYLSQLLRDKAVTISILARGIAFGGELEFADELTLGRSIQARMPYQLTNS